MVVDGIANGASEAICASAILEASPVGVLMVDQVGVIRHAGGSLTQTIGLESDALKSRTIYSLLASTHDIDRSELAIALNAKSACVLVLRILGGAIGNPNRTVTAFVQYVSEPKLESAAPVWAVYIRSIGSWPLSKVGPDGSASAGDPAALFERLMSRLSRDMRTPLNVILGNAELMLMDGQQGVAGNHLDMVRRILEAGWYLNDMTDRIREFSQLQAGTLQLVLGPVDVESVVLYALDRLQPQAFERGITLRLFVHPGVGRIKADKARVEQIMMNLLSNAIKYNLDDGTVVVDVAQHDSAAVSINVRDTGAGLAAPQLAALFQPFNRLGMDATVISGAGVGLCICLCLAVHMHGGLSASSEPGVGTNFRLVLPSTDRCVAGAAVE